MSLINFGYDASGNGNNWTANNLNNDTTSTGTDSLVDTPTNYGTDTGAGGEVRGNYCTLNPLDNAQGATISNGNLQVVNANATDKLYRGTFGMPSGKWYWEVQLTTVGNRNSLGVTDIAQIYNSTALNGSYAVVTVGNQTSSTSGSLSGSIPTFSANDYITFALDIAAGTLYFEKNAAPNISTSPKFTGLSTTTTYFVTNREAGNAPAGQNTFNFGQRPFAYTAPSGFKALVTTNLPEPTIADGGGYFNTVLYTGNGSTQSITGVGFQPDFTWIKARSDATSHQLFDVLRGATVRLFTDLTNAEETNTESLKSFTSDGFTVGTNLGVNGSGRTLAAWNWKANGAGVTNTAGTITSTVSANTDSGFSIVTYTGTGANATVGHGLGVAPAMVIIKERNGTGFWVVGHTSLGWSYYTRLNDTFAVEGPTAVAWNNTAPSSTVVSLGTSNILNNSGSNLVMYCFAAIPGYSAFGSYTGNGSADGPFVYTGFRPALIIRKRTNDIGYWIMMDDKRNTYNLTDNRLLANLSNAEANNGNNIDILSNGWKERNADGYSNASGSTYIYMAFAENPFKISRAR